MVTVYALIDPLDKSVRYIGIAEDIYSRMRQHSRCAGNNAAKNAWVQELQQKRVMFIMCSLEHVDTYTKALEREQYWIRHYLEAGAPLTNIAGVPAASRIEVSLPKVKHYTVEELQTMYFRSEDGRILNVIRASSPDFHEYIQHFVKLGEKFDAYHWESHSRRHVINHVYKNGGEVEFCDAPTDGKEDKHIWIVPRNPEIA